MKVFNWTNIRLVLMFSLVIFLFSFTSKRNENRKREEKTNNNKQEKQQKEEEKAIWIKIQG